MYVLPVVVIISLCVITRQKIDQAGGPETYFNFVWPDSHAIHLQYFNYACRMAICIDVIRMITTYVLL